MLKYVKPQPKGMVTIPFEFRQKLGIDENSLLEARMVGSNVVFAKVKTLNDKYDYYTDEQIEKWMELDQLDKKTATKLAKLLK